MERSSASSAACSSRNFGSFAYGPTVGRFGAGATFLAAGAFAVTGEDLVAAPVAFLASGAAFFADAVPADAAAFLPVGTAFLPAGTAFLPVVTDLLPAGAAPFEASVACLPPGTARFDAGAAFLPLDTARFGAVLLEAGPAFLADGASFFGTDFFAGWDAALAPDEALRAGAALLGGRAAAFFAAVTSTSSRLGPRRGRDRSRALGQDRPRHPTGG